MMRDVMPADARTTGPPAPRGESTSPSGVRDPALLTVLSALRSASCFSRGGKESPDDAVDLLERAVTAAVSESQPETPVEAMLLNQMVACHLHAAQALAKAANARAPEEVDRWTRISTKLLEVYARQCDALAKLRRKGTQVMRIERVTVEAGGQAVVAGTVATRGIGQG
jgi:hypothetical protein